VYRQLEAARIVETLERLGRRIEERFPGAGLGKVCAELLAAAHESVERAALLQRPTTAASCCR